MIHHVSIEVAVMERSAGFYDALFKPLGWRRLYDADGAVAWGLDHPVFWIRARERPHPGLGHIAFAASGIAAVKAAWQAGIDAGATDEGSPGQRAEYGSGYYAAYLRDPDGHRIEIAVGPH